MTHRVLSRDTASDTIVSTSTSTLGAPGGGASELSGGSDAKWNSTAGYHHGCEMANSVGAFRGVPMPRLSGEDAVYVQFGHALAECSTLEGTCDPRAKGKWESFWNVYRVHTHLRRSAASYYALYLLRNGRKSEAYDYVRLVCGDGPMDTMDMDHLARKLMGVVQAVLSPPTAPSSSAASHSTLVTGLSFPHKAPTLPTSVSPETTASTKATDPLCILCETRPRRVRLEPCGHYSMCEECTKRCIRCPHCRVYIKSAQLTYFC